MSLSQSKIKLLRSLRQKKFRQKYNFFIAEGLKISIDLLSSEKMDIVEVFAMQEWIDKFPPLASKYSDITTIVSGAELKKVSSLTTPNLVLILAKIPDVSVNHSLMESGCHLLCDSIQDPGNMGTIIRTADWFGITTVSATSDSVDYFNPKVIQASMGSICSQPIQKIDGDKLTAFVESFDQVIGTDMTGSDLFSFDIAHNSLIIIGNEGKGISDRLKSMCSDFVTIPGRRDTTADSLNAAVSTAILCAELKRRKLV